MPEPANREVPKLSVFLGIIGMLEFIGGSVLCLRLWPGRPDTGYKWLFSAYVPALTWLAAGIASALLFFAIAAIVAYLFQIRAIGEDMLASSCRLEAIQDIGRRANALGGRTG